MPLERVLEPEVMDTPEEARDYDRMDHAAVNRLFVEDLLSFIKGQGIADLGDALDVGTGTALIPIELCRAHSCCRVMAIDMAVHMLELARYNIEAAGLIAQITLAQVDAKAMPYRDGMFDAAVSNSIVHHIPEPMNCLREMVRVTRRTTGLFLCVICCDRQMTKRSSSWYKHMPAKKMPTPGKCLMIRCGPLCRWKRFVSWCRSWILIPAACR